MGDGVNKGNFDEKYWHKGTNHETNNLKLQTYKYKTSNNKHEQPTLKLDMWGGGVIILWRNVLSKEGG